MKLYPIPPRVGTLAPEHRADAVALLQAARPLLRGPGGSLAMTPFICNALFLAGRGRPVSKYLEALINSRLGGETYQGWLDTQGYDDWGCEWLTLEQRDRVQASRLAWMDDMIAEFSGELPFVL